VLDKLNRKDRRRAERGGADADLEWLLVNGFEALLEAELDSEQGDSIRSIRFHNCDGLIVLALNICWTPNACSQIHGEEVSASVSDVLRFHDGTMRVGPSSDMCITRRVVERLGYCQGRS